MKIIVCLKQVPDTETKIKIQNGRMDSTGVKWIVNPYDEFAIEEALLLKAKWAGSTVTAISAGPKTRVVDSLRTALAMGADEAVVVDIPEEVDNLTTAKALAAAIKKQEGYKAIFTGKVAIDDNSMSVSQMIAEILKLPHATNVSKTDHSETTVTVEREIEGGTKEIVELKWPAVLGANKGLNTPRYASLPGIMKAKKKPVTEMSLQDLGIESGTNRTFITNLEAPNERPKTIMIEGDAETQVKTLVSSLRNEAKVI